MSSTIFFFSFVPLLCFILLAVNLLFAPHNPYLEKNNVFECGYSSFLGQNRTQFSISFFIFALLFLLFDLEILLVYPYLVSAYANEIYGLAILLIFLLVLTLGFVFELGKKALTIDSRQVTTSPVTDPSHVSTFNDISNLKISKSSLYPTSIRLSLINVNAKTCKRLFSISSHLAWPLTHAEIEAAQKAITKGEQEMEETIKESEKLAVWSAKRACEGNFNIARAYRHAAEDVASDAGNLWEELEERQYELDKQKVVAGYRENPAEFSNVFLAKGSPEEISAVQAAAAARATASQATTTQATAGVTTEAATTTGVATEAATNTASSYPVDSAMIAAAEALCSMWQ